MLLLLLNSSQIIAVIGPVTIFAVVYIRRRNAYDLHHAILGSYIYSTTTTFIAFYIVLARGTLYITPMVTARPANQAQVSCSPC